MSNAHLIKTDFPLIRNLQESTQSALLPGQRHEAKELELPRKTKDASKGVDLLERYSAKEFDIHQHIVEIFNTLVTSKEGPHAFLVNALYDVPLQEVDFYLPQIW